MQHFVEQAQRLPREQHHVRRAIGSAGPDGPAPRDGADDLKLHVATALEIKRQLSRHLKQNRPQLPRA